MGFSYRVNPFIVRGLDYYTKTVFEFISDKIGAQATICGGGRYDGLVEELGGPPTPALGFGMGLDRLLLVMENLAVSFLRRAVICISAAWERTKRKGSPWPPTCAGRVLLSCDTVGRSVKPKCAMPTSKMPPLLYHRLQRAGAGHGHRQENGRCQQTRWLDGEALSQYLYGKRLRRLPRRKVCFFALHLPLKE